MDRLCSPVKKARQQIAYATRNSVCLSNIFVRCPHGVLLVPSMVFAVQSSIDSFFPKSESNSCAITLPIRVQISADISGKQQKQKQESAAAETDADMLRASALARFYKK